MINKILQEDMDFHNTVHERNLYVRKEPPSLLCQQVDDFAASACNSTEGCAIIAAFDKHVTTSDDGFGVKTNRGFYTCFNGLDVYQTRQYIHVNVGSYIRVLCKTHGWETPSRTNPDNTNSVPLRPCDTGDRLQTLVGPEDGSKEHKALEKQHGFGYRNVLGEVIFAYVACCGDISFAVSFLSKFSSNLHHDHYVALKNLVCHLRCTADWGIY